MNTKRLTAFLLVLLLMAAPLTACSPKSNLTTVKVNEVTHSVFYAPFYAAINLGFFEEEGLSLELTNGGGSDKSMTALVSGDADIGLMGPETAVYVYNEGKADYPMIIGQLTRRDGSFLLSREDEKDFDWSNLAGTEIIAGRTGGMPEMTLEYVLKQKGYDLEKDLTLNTGIQFNAMGGAFAGGTGDYVTLFEPTASQFVNQSQGYIVAAVGDEGGDVPYTCFMATQDTLKNRSDLVESFMRAVYKGQQYVDTHTDAEVAAALLPSFTDSDEALLTQVVARYREIGAWNTDPILSKEMFDRMITIIDAAGQLKDSVSYDALVEMSVAEKVMK
ncbi:MAG: ABC transporter substrate-binding protein [Christensenellales bacterium]|jgi:NitT/TauT family transport system substrate-binding protein